MIDLFGFVERHDAGGKVRTALPPGIKGDAAFAGAQDQYRPILRRWVGDDFPASYVALVGMNPSEATEQKNDPTITREWGFIERWGYRGFVKVNVSDYRATKQKALNAPGLVLRSDAYWDSVWPAIERAEVVVACWGNVPKALRPLAAEMRERLRARSDVMCFGLNADGSPKHPLYLANSTELVPFEP